MKKIKVITAAVVVALALASCGETENPAKVNVSSEKYVDDELVVTMKNMKETLDAQGKQPDKITYFGDEVCDGHMIEKLKEAGVLEEDSKAAECIGFEVDYHYSPNVIVMLRSKLGSGEYDTKQHEGAQYWFAREENGEWECVSSEEPIL
jgi:hypothetical protein